MTVGKRKRIMLTAGGTGGHLFPAIAVAQGLKARGHDVYLMIDKRAAAFQKDMAGISVIQMPLGPKGPGVWGKIKFILSLVYSTLFASLTLIRIHPRLIVGFGGYPSFPALAARNLFLLFPFLFMFFLIMFKQFFLLDIPFLLSLVVYLFLSLSFVFLRPRLILHEQNAYLGRVNWFFCERYLSRLALSFPDTKKIPGFIMGRNVVTGMPLRASILKLADTPYIPPKKDDPFSILILGGSQGTQVFGEIIPKAIAELPEKLRRRLVITQQSRRGQEKIVKEAYSEIGVKAVVQPFFDNVEDLMTQAHLIICRAGSSSTWEIVTARRPALFIPLPTAMDDHQTHNAEYVEKSGGAWVMPQKDLTPVSLAKLLEKLMETPQLLMEASNNLKEIAPQNATEKLVDLVESV